MLCVVHPQSGNLQLGVSVDQQGLRLQPLQFAVLCLVQASVLATPLVVQRLYVCNNNTQTLHVKDNTFRV